MADLVSENLPVKAEPLSNSDDGNFVFPFKLPEDGLALRSVGIVEGAPELRFGASPKVPTISEQDVATIFRLVKEGKRPEFFYLQFPPTHPLHLSRVFKQYSPAWLRGTEIGELLAEADWTMKCLNVGTRTNKKKTVFKSWSKESNLYSLATSLDFPRVADAGSIIMSCEYAKLQKGDNEIVFPEEPKIKIKSDCSPLYSKYLTEIYQSIAYHDEPMFLKLQELIKLILAVEWFYKEKGVRVSEDWMTKHTCKLTDPMAHLELSERKKPPYKMIPQPNVFMRPSSDVTVRTWEAEMYNTLRTKCDVEQRYGYYDFCGAEVIMFKKNGTPCPPLKCLKVGIEHHLSIAHQSIEKVSAWCYLRFPVAFEPTKFRDDLLSELPQNSLKAITFPVPTMVDTTVDDSTDESGVEVKITRLFQPCPPLALPPVRNTTVARVTMDNYDKLFASMDPNEPIRPEILGLCKEIIPGVKSWDELFSELSDPIPRMWQVPFVGIGEPTVGGGVTTRDFRVEEERLQTRAAPVETQWKDNYIRRNDRLLVVRARPARVTAQGMYIAMTCYSHLLFFLS